jgi:hypothetical protein
VSAYECLLQHAVSGVCNGHMLLAVVRDGGFTWSGCPLVLIERRVMRSLSQVLT